MPGPSSAAPQKLAPGLTLLPGARGSRFPYSAGLLVQGSQGRLLIDCGMGRQMLEAALGIGFDAVVFTHCHVDHRLSFRYIPEKPAWIHELDAPYLADLDAFIKGIGYAAAGLDYHEMFGHLELPSPNPARRLTHGEELDLGGLTLRVVHTPGHTPGHVALYVPEREFVFLADIDLTRFGPMYGHEFSDIDDFLMSIERVRRLNARLAATGHTAPVAGAEEIRRALDAFGAVVHARDERIVALLSRPRRLGELLNRNVIYPSYPASQGVTRWFEEVHVKKQLARLVRLGRARQEGGVWSRA